MPKDSRLYMTFPIDFDEHPKVAPLSDAAFRAFIEMNAYSRRQSLDGRIAAATARRRWKGKALAELVASHPERPLVALEGDVYVIRDYAEHQLTVAAIEALREKRAAAGRRGGEAKAKTVASAKANATASAVANPVDNPALLEANRKQSHRVIESREDLTDIKHPPQSSHVSTARDPEADPGEFLARMKERALLRAEQAGIRDLVALRDHLETTTLERLTLGAALEIAEVILARAAGPVRNADAYVISSCRTTPAEVREIASQIDVAAIV
jgi:hypothetical protein